MELRTNDTQLLTFDSETTGLFPEQGYVMLQFGAMHESGDTFNVTIQPTEEQWLNAHPKALEVNGLTWEKVMDGVPISQAGDMFTEWLRAGKYIGKHTILAGQNPAFDMKFMWYSWFNSLSDIGFPKRSDQVLNAQTVYVIWSNVVKKKLLKMDTRTSLKNMCIEVGVKEEPEPHDALQGAQATMRVLLEMFRQIELYSVF